jgi:hypothetical protein
MQYTIRGVPEAVDAALRERAKRDDRSLNETAVTALAEGVGLSGLTRRRRDVSPLIRHWKRDRVLEREIEQQDRIDPDMWR